MIEGEQISKSQRKKQAKQQRISEQKPLRRAQDRERKKQRIAKAREENDVEYLQQLKKKQANRKAPSKAQLNHSNVSVVLDCAFDELQGEREVVSLSNQLTTCYAHNKHTVSPTHLQVTSYNGRLKQRLDPLKSGWDDDKITFTDSAVEEVYKPSDCVYLTADTDNVLDELDTSKHYILGAMVDHNRLKNITVDKAKSLGMAVAALPISKYIRLSTRRVLTVNQVYEILTEYIKQNDWQKAFFSVIPQRKLDTAVEGESEVGKECDTVTKEAKEEANEKAAKATDTVTDSERIVVSVLQSRQEQ
ncbi:hypothetical protein E3P98_03121 [Wallemia ichthyophaga]|uniref:tRNA (guanine(9)-N1)-methyltransferase n=1 Tax=Wallemia ichthyophaga TaxID=245174 RepID=A0A4T0EXF5_WALIC|nr:hypothetical protein E3P98_03121 [Wallemia ichthyophaga]TIB39204.1 hypothetical protein E3P86_01220 [Wallemia ichthyophaga]